MSEARLMRALTMLLMWLWPICTSACAPREPAEGELRRVGFPIVLAVQNVRVYRSYDIGGGPTLEVTFLLPKNLLRNADASIKSAHAGYALFDAPNRTGRPWRPVRLSLAQVWAPPRRIGVAVGWDTRYDSDQGVVGVISYGRAPTPERRALLERFPCRDLLAQVYVRKEGWTILSHFITIARPSPGPACISAASAAAWAIR